MNQSVLSVLRNQVHDTWKYDFKKINDEYVIYVEQSQEDIDDTVHINTHNYHLKEIKWGKINGSEIDYTDIEPTDVNTTDCDVRRLGKDNIESDKEYDMSGNENENETVIDFGGKYINVCRACNEATVSGSDILVCPHCGGVYTEVYDAKTYINSDPTMLTGSYLLDLYFE